MSLPNFAFATASIKSTLVFSKIFRFSYLKKHHLLFAVEIAILSLTGLFLAVGSQAAVNNLFTKPKVIETYPPNLGEKAEVAGAIRIAFSNPVDQTSLKPTINPPVQGSWEFTTEGVGLLKKELVFKPEVTLQPGTNYYINIESIKPIFFGSKANYSFNFKTKDLPKVVSAENSTLGPNDNFIINLDTANTFMADFNFSFDPSIEFEQSLSPNKKQYILTPKNSLKQGSSYQLTTQKSAIIYNLKTNKRIKKTAVIYDLKSKKVLEQDQPSPELPLNFTTLAQPTIPLITAKGTAAPTGPITVSFDKKMDKFSVANSLKISPKIKYTLSWKSDKSLVITPNQSLPFNTSFQLTFAKGTKAQDGTFLENDFTHQFTTIGNVKVSQFIPSSNSKNVAIGSKIYVTFNQSVNKQSAQSHFSISPNVSGTFSWNQNMLIFSPSAKFPYSKTYTVTISSGVKSLNALDSITTFKTTFTTASLYEVIKLKVPIFKQKYSLSCEFAAMRMVLAYRGISKSENQLIAETPFDNTKHSGNIWGDPSIGFLGNYKGTYFGDGYGAYYPVIVGEVSKYRPAKAYVGWNVTSLLKEVKAGNPVIIWSCLICNRPRYWNTPTGKRIYAYEYYHMMVVVGYTGTVQNPQSIILNDPYAGRQISYSKSQFTSRWSIMNYTAVVVK